MIQYFKEGPGRKALGKWHSIALNASQQLEGEVVKLGRLLLPTEEPKTRKNVESWVAEHPIESPLFYRNSVATKFADIAAGVNLRTFEVVRNLATTVDDMKAQLPIYSKHLPNQARWQAELLIGDLIAKEKVDVMLEELNSLSKSLSLITTVVEQSPEIISSERIAAIQSINEQRLSTLDWVTKERSIITNDLQKTLQKERITVLSFLREERILAMKDIEAASQQMMENALSASELLIDHFFLRSAQLLGALLIVVFLITGVIAIYLFKQKGPAQK